MVTELRLMNQELRCAPALRFPYMLVMAIGAIIKRIAVVPRHLFMAVGARLFNRRRYLPYVRDMAAFAFGHNIIFADILAYLVMAGQAEFPALKLPCVGGVASRAV